MKNYSLCITEEVSIHGRDIHASVTSLDQSIEYGQIRLCLTLKGAYDFTTEHLVAMGADIFACSEYLEVFLSKHRLQKFIWIDQVERFKEGPKGVVAEALKELISQYSSYSSTLLCYPCSYTSYSEASAQKLSEYYSTHLGMALKESFCIKV